MDELNRLRTFIKVVEAGSFSRVARDTSSVSSVARQVKALEDELGARLLNRNSRRLSLTDAGQRLYERSQALVVELDSVKAEIMSLQDEAKGPLRVSLRTAAGTAVVIPALPELLEKYPGLEIEILLTDERLDFIANKIDVAVWMGELPNTDLIARRLSRTNRYVCASPAYLERHGVPSRPEELVNHECLRFMAPSYGPKWRFTKEGETVEVNIKGCIRADNGLVLLSSALLGLGLVVIPEWMARSHLAEGRLVRILEDYVVSPYPGHAEHFAVFPTSRGMSRKVRVFVDFLVETFSEPRGK